MLPKPRLTNKNIWTHEKNKNSISKNSLKFSATIGKLKEGECSNGCKRSAWHSEHREGGDTLMDHSLHKNHTPKEDEWWAAQNKIVVLGNHGGSFTSTWTRVHQDAGNRMKLLKSKTHSMGLFPIGKPYICICQSHCTGTPASTSSWNQRLTQIHLQRGLPSSEEWWLFCYSLTKQQSVRLANAKIYSDSWQMLK